MVQSMTPGVAEVLAGVIPWAVCLGDCLGPEGLASLLHLPADRLLGDDGRHEARKVKQR